MNHDGDKLKIKANQQVETQKEYPKVGAKVDHEKQN